MSAIIPIVPLSGSISGGGKLQGSLSGQNGLRGQISNNIVHKDYEELVNKPSIEGITLIGNKTFEDFGYTAITPQEIDEIIYGGQNG